MHVRRASPLDARAMADLLNEIIDIGGTTARKDRLSGEDMRDWLAEGAAHTAWHVAEDDTGALLGFQTIGPKPALGPDACDISTFAKVGKTQLGIGSSLFKATQKAAKALGYGWINARIRAYNEGGLAYYQSRGFEPYKRDDVSVFMRYNL